MFTRMTGKRFSGSGERPTTSATALPTHGHTPEHPILADFNAAFLGDAEPALASTTPFWGALLRACPFGAALLSLWPSPVEEGFAIAASRCNPFEAGPAALQARDKT
jgi:hypothetical protein